MIIPIVNTLVQISACDAERRSRPIGGELPVEPQRYLTDSVIVVISLGLHPYGNIPPINL
jgi:hypothetical protein